MKKIIIVISTFGFLLLSGIAQSTPRQALLVLAKRDHTLAIVDPGTLKVLTRIPVGDDPHEVVASADGKTAFVSNYTFGVDGTLAAIDLTVQKALPTIDLGPLRAPHGLAFAAGRVWFTAEAAKAIARYDPAAKKVDWILGTGQNRTHMIYVAPDLSWMATTNVSSATLSLIERGNQPQAADWNETVIPVGKGAEGFDVSPDGKEIWVANAQDGTVSIINRAGRKVTETLAANMKGANRLKFTPDGQRVLISSLHGGDLAVLDASTRKEVKRLKLGSGAAGILIEPNGARAFVACSPDNYVAVIDLKTLQIVGHIDAGREPDGMAWAVNSVR